MPRATEETTKIKKPARRFKIDPTRSSRKQLFRERKAFPQNWTDMARVKRVRARPREEETGWFKLWGTTRECRGAGKQENPRSLWGKCCGGKQ